MNIIIQGVTCFENHTVHKRGSGDGSPQRGPGVEPSKGSGGLYPPEVEALLLNKHAIFNAPLMKIVTNRQIIKILLHTCHLFKNSHCKF